MQSPSFLAHQRYLQEGQGRSNCETLFGISKIPGDSHLVLDLPSSPSTGCQFCEAGLQTNMK
jgi:hypothetical protein